MNRLICTFV